MGMREPKGLTMPSVISEGLSPERRRLRSQKGVAVRLGHRAEADRLDAEIRTERLADYIRETVDSAPPLTDQQRQRLALLLTRQGSPDAAA